MSRRTGVLVLAVLGLLHESPMHGYELRKRLNAMLGTFRAFSYGSLYPCLKELLAEGLITEDPQRTSTGKPGGRSKIVYKLTAEGKEHLQDLLDRSGPAAWEDESFGVHFAFFSQTEPDARLRILEGRRSRLEERLDNVRSSLARTRERLDSNTLELQRHGLESVEREVRWLNELISDERGREELTSDQTTELISDERGREELTSDQTTELSGSTGTYDQHTKPITADRALPGTTDGSPSNNESKN